MAAESEGSIAILDTGPLIALHRLDTRGERIALSSLSVLYGQVLIPQQVEAEFLAGDPDAGDWLLRVLDSEQSWLQKCSDYSDDAVVLWRTAPGVDIGEAGSFAQQQTRGARHEIILDDERARKQAEASQIPYLGFARILAKLDYRFQLLNAVDVARWLQAGGYRITEGLVRKCLRLEAGQSE